MEINKHIIFYPLDSKFIKKCTTSAGVYMIRNILNSKSYIGSSYSLKRRLTDHLSHLKYNRHANHHL
jgi:excinuclease UvrABC nuclease subunit